MPKLPDIRHPLITIGDRLRAERGPIRKQSAEDEEPAENPTAEKLKLRRRGRPPKASLDSRMGAIASLKELAAAKDVPWETRRKCINDIIEKSGWAVSKTASDFKTKTHDELIRYIEDVVLVALEEIGVRDSRNR